MSDIIVITSCPFQENVDEIWKMAQNDSVLIDSIKRVAKEKELDGEEIFERRYNIIATNTGFYFAFYEKDLSKVNNQ